MKTPSAFMSALAVASLSVLPGCNDKPSGKIPGLVYDLTSPEVVEFDKKNLHDNNVVHFEERKRSLLDAFVSTSAVLQDAHLLEFAINNYESLGENEQASRLRTTLRHLTKIPETRRAVSNSVSALVEDMPELSHTNAHTNGISHVCSSIPNRATEQECLHRYYQSMLSAGNRPIFTEENCPDDSEDSCELINDLHKLNALKNAIVELGNLIDKMRGESHSPIHIRWYKGERPT